MTEETVLGQLAAGDLYYGNQIWPDPGIYIEVSVPLGPAPVRVGFGFEFVYDWSNDGNPGTGWNAFLYPHIGITSSPGLSGGAGYVSVYNFIPENYQETFYNTTLAAAISFYGGPAGGFSYTPDGFQQWLDGEPVTEPYSYYGGWQLGGGYSYTYSWQWYDWLNKP